MHRRPKAERQQVLPEPEEARRAKDVMWEASKLPPGRARNRAFPEACKLQLTYLDPKSSAYGQAGGMCRTLSGFLGEE